MDQEQQQSRIGNGSHQRYDPPFWEKAVAGAGLLMLFALLAYLLYEAVAGDDSPPNILVEIEEVRASGEDYLVTFRARNDGGQTAHGVVITGELRRWGIVFESAETTLDFIPAESARKGGLFFTEDPRVADLHISSSGYTLP